MTMVVKRRLSPTTMESVSTTSSSASTDLHSESGHGDQVLPLYSERMQAQHQYYPQYRTMMLGFGNASTGSGSLEDDSDHDHADDLSSTCSSRVNPPWNPTSSILKSSSALSVASEPCLPLWSRSSSQQQLQLQLQNSPRQHSHGSYGSNGGDSFEEESAPSRSTFVFTARKRKNPIYLIVAAFSALGMFLYGQSHATLHDALQQVLTLHEERRKVHAQFHNVERDIRTLQRQMMELTSAFEQQAAAAAGGENGAGRTGVGLGGGLAPTSSNPLLHDGVDEMNTLQEKLKEGSAQIGNLQRHLQEISKRDAILKYGSGKIRVKLELEFPNASYNLKDGPNTFIMEMAPLDMMPHSVFMFLEMVDAKLFDGCSFILNAMHVIKAAPLPYDGSSAAAKVRSFAARGLESVAFREYSPDFPHDQYSVGFAADDSPSFYINTQDNSDVHVGEPCFAKIISGFDTIKRMEEAPTRNGIWYRQRIGIKRAYIL